MIEALFGITWLFAAMRQLQSGRRNAIDKAWQDFLGLELQGRKIQEYPTLEPHVVAKSRVPLTELVVAWDKAMEAGELPPGWEWLFDIAVPERRHLPWTQEYPLEFHYDEPASEGDAEEEMQNYFETQTGVVFKSCPGVHLWVHELRTHDPRTHEEIVETSERGFLVRIRAFPISIENTVHTMEDIEVSTAVCALPVDLLWGTFEGELRGEPLDHLPQLYYRGMVCEIFAPVEFEDWGEEDEDE